MRIAFSGAACTGKSTIIQHFLQKWPNYKLINSDYRKLIKKKNHSKNTTVELQEKILDILCSEVKPYTLHENVVFDRCPLDNLIYSMWCSANNVKGFDDKFIENSLYKVRESMSCFDIIFICTRDLMPPIEKNGIREIDPKYVEEIDNIFKAIIKKYKDTPDKLPFLKKDDSPAIIDIYGQPFERIAQIAMYITEDGDMFGEKESLLDINELTEMQKLLYEQKEALNDEKTPIIKI
jgi:hypothetical protein